MSDVRKDQFALGVMTQSAARQMTPRTGGGWRPVAGNEGGVRMTAEERLALRLLMTEFPLEVTYCGLPNAAGRQARGDERVLRGHKEGRGICRPAVPAVRDPETLTDDDLRKYHWYSPFRVPVAGEPGRWLAELVFRADYASWATPDQRGCLATFPPMVMSARRLWRRWRRNDVGWKNNIFP